MNNSYRDWIRKNVNCRFDYFGRHDQGKPVTYQFNSQGYRGPEHYSNPDISVFGSSFSFGIGLEFDQCWHQLLGKYRVNSYAVGGILMTNNDIIDHYHNTTINSGISILQLREYRYNTSQIIIPDNVLIFAIDEHTIPGMLNLSWSSFVDKAEDNTHPGANTHKLWAKIIKKTFNL